MNGRGGGRSVSGSRAPLLLGALVAAAVGVVVVWFLIPRTADAFSATGNALAAKNALPAGSQGPSSASVLPVFTSSGLAGPASFPADAVGRDVAKADRYSPTIAVEVGKGDSFAVAPVVDPGPSAVPVLVAAAVVGALAWLGGALFSRRRPAPVTAGTQAIGDRQAAGAGQAVRGGQATGAGQATWGGQATTAVRGLPPGTEPVADSELRQLRLSAQQKTALARSVAELVPSLPDALVWRAEQALADVGVRSVVPDGQLFDAQAHHVVGTEPVPRGGRENTIARTIRPGYADGETILVYPKVIVYADDTDGRTR